MLKIAPETSIKLGLNDYLRRNIHADTEAVAPWERMLCGGVSGAVGQVRGGDRKKGYHDRGFPLTQICLQV